MKTWTLLFALVLAISVNAQFAFEKAPGIMHTTNPETSRDTFNLQFQFPCAAFIGEYGIESDGEFIYVTQWLNDSIAKYDMSGNVLETFVIPGVGQVRDLAWDGTYFYGSPNDYKFYVLDFQNKVLVNTFTTDMRIRGMAYDEDTDALWVSEHWSPSFFRLDKTTGATLDTLAPSGITLDAISGLAYDNISPGGPFLWGFSQDSTGALIIKYDIPNATQTGNMIDVSDLSAPAAAYAGGLFIEDMDNMAGISIGGMIQNQEVFGLELGYANQLVGLDEAPSLEMKLYPNPVIDRLTIEVGNQSEYQVTIFNQLGQIVLEKTVSSQKSSINTSVFDEGIYMVQFIDVNGRKASSTFIKAD